MILIWQPIYSVNVGEIDEQHRKLFNIINKFFSLNKGENMEGILKELEEYAIYHFNTEEKYFKKFSYPEEESHKKMHQFYVDKVAEFKKRQKNEDIYMELREFLKNWWLGHIQNADQAYSNFFNQNGLL